MAELLGESADLAFIEDGMFRLFDDEAPDYSNGDDPDSPCGFVLVGGTVGLATFISGFQDNEPYVRLEHWSAAPDDPDGPWEATFHDQIYVPGGRLVLVSGISALPSPHELTLPPGSYHLAVWCRGRTAVLEGAAAAIMAGTIQQGVELWIIRLWPATTGSHI